MVREALAQLPDHGPVRVVATTVGPDGRPEVRVEQAATPQAGAAALVRLGADDEVTAVELDSRVEAFDHPISNDALRGSQWGMTRLDAEHVWGTSRGAGATIAVIDSGVDGTHPDLQGALVDGYDYVTGGGNGLIDPGGHGTHVAGIAVAVPGNSTGVIGLAPDARVMSLRVLNASGSGLTSHVAAAVVKAVDDGADVINLSLGGPGNSAAVALAVEYAVDSGVPVVASMGNERTAGDPILYPAALPGVIAVAATGTNDVSGFFSSTGAHVSVSAPGVSILSTTGGTYALKSGTSMAAPHVSAVVALLHAVDAGLSTEEVRSVLMSTAEDLECAGFDYTTGAGLVDPLAALEALGEEPPPPPAGERGDWTGGGTVDVLATTSTGVLRSFPGCGDGSLGKGATVGSGWKSMTYLGSPGDITGDDRTDLVARSSTGAMFLYPGRGGGLVSNGQQVGSGWNVMTALVTPGDLDGDGRPDLLARRTDGTLHHYRFGTTGALSYVRQVGTGWNGMAWMTGMGDINGDGFGDVLGVNSSGTMLRYWGSASGLRGGGVVGTGWGGMTWVTSPGDMNGDGRGDLLVRDSAANLRFYPGSATGVSNGRQVGSGWGGFSRIL